MLESISAIKPRESLSEIRHAQLAAKALLVGDKTETAEDLCREAEDDAGGGLQKAQTSVVARVGPAALTDDAVLNGETAPKAAGDPKAIWADDEIPPEEALAFMNNDDDPRPRVKFSMRYKQAVGTEDMCVSVWFLGGCGDERGSPGRYSRRRPFGT